MAEACSRGEHQGPTNCIENIKSQFILKIKLSPGYQHCYTAQKKYCSSNGEKPPCNDPPGFSLKSLIVEFIYQPVLVADDHDEPDE